MDPTTKLVAYFTAASLVSAALLNILRNAKAMFDEGGIRRLFHRLEPKLTEVANLDLGAINELKKNSGSSVKDKIDQGAVDNQRIIAMMESQDKRIDAIRPAIKEAIEAAKTEIREEQGRVKEELINEQKRASTKAEGEQEKTRAGLLATSRDLLEHREMMARYIIHEANGSLNYSKLKEDEERLLKDIADQKSAAEARQRREAEFNEPAGD